MASDGNLHSRIEHLADHMGVKPDQFVFMDLICDGCNRVHRLDPTNPEDPTGWRLGPFGAGQDYCPKCAKNA